MPTPAEPCSSTLLTVDPSAWSATSGDDVRRMDDRLRDVEIALGKVDQRLATLERRHLLTPGD